MLFVGFFRWYSSRFRSHDVPHRRFAFLQSSTAHVATSQQSHSTYPHSFLLVRRCRVLVIRLVVCLALFDTVHGLHVVVVVVVGRFLESSTSSDAETRGQGGEEVA